MSPTWSNARVLLARGVLGAVRAHAHQALPGECCGALLGRATNTDATVERALPLPNQSAEVRAYLVGPEGVRAAEAAAARAGLEVVGFYHSHPASAPAPSPADLEAGWPWYTYLLVDAATGEARAWTLAEDRSAFVERALGIEDRT